MYIIKAWYVMWLYTLSKCFSMYLIAILNKFIIGERVYCFYTAIKKPFRTDKNSNQILQPFFLENPKRKNDFINFMFLV